MRKRAPRRWQVHDEHDPLAGLVNLFDLWMVFSIALLIVFVGSSSRHRDAGAESDTSTRPSEGPAKFEQARSIERYRLSREELTGAGERLGMAYRLPSGEIVCVPDDPSTADRTGSGR
jgi:hypothetical protein